MFNKYILSFLILFGSLVTHGNPFLNKQIARAACPALAVVTAGMMYNAAEKIQDDIKRAACISLITMGWVSMGYAYTKYLAK